MQDLEDKAINQRFALQKQMTRGGFGTIFFGTDKQMGDRVAIKLQLIKNKKGERCVPEEELQIHRSLRKIQGVVEYRSGGDWRVDGMNIKFIVTPLAQSSMEEVCKANEGKRDVAPLCEKTVSLIGIQLMKAIKDIHSKGVLHRDLKCQNYLFFPFERPMVQITDFGLSCRFRDRQGRRITPLAYPEIHHRLPYCALGVAKQQESTELDDLWQVVYSLLRMRAYEPFARMSIKDRLKLKEKLAVEPHNCVDDRQYFLCRFIKLIGRQASPGNIDYDGLIDKLTATIRGSRRDNGQIPLKKEKSTWKMI